MGGITGIIVGVFPIFLAFTTTYFLVKKWITIARKLGFLSKDMNKYEKPLVAEPGGPFVIISIIMAFLVFAILAELYKIHIKILIIFAVSIATILSGYLGLFDDIMGWKKGLKAWQKPLFSFIFAIPISLIKLHDTTVILPFFGKIDLGLFYPLFLIPVGIIGTSNAINMIAGYNGLETVMSILLFSAVAAKAILVKNIVIALLALITISSLLAFLLFNKYPSKIFPGDSFTYPMGTLFGALIILGDMEKFGLVLFSLYFIELLLFMRGLFNGTYKENFGIPDKNNCLKPPYEKIYSLTHFALKILGKRKKCVTENDVVLFIGLLQLVVTIFAFALA